MEFNSFIFNNIIFIIAGYIVFLILFMTLPYPTLYKEKPMLWFVLAIVTAICAYTYKWSLYEVLEYHDNLFFYICELLCIEYGSGQAAYSTREIINKNKINHNIRRIIIAILIIISNSSLMWGNIR